MASGISGMIGHFMFSRPVSIVICIAGLLMSGPQATAQTLNEDSQSYAMIAATIEKRIDVDAILAQCPADLSEEMGDLYEDLGAECKEHPSSCLAQCLDEDRYSACFELAVWFQSADQPNKRMQEVLFAKACAIGGAGGCTNRAAGMLSRESEGMRLHPDREETVGSCAARTFRATCEADDAWGCTMYGLDLFRGENLPGDPDQAVHALTKACILGPVSEPCNFANAILRKIKEKPVAQ